MKFDNFEMYNKNHFLTIVDCLKYILVEAVTKKLPKLFFIQF